MISMILTGSLVMACREDHPENPEPEPGPGPTPDPKTEEVSVRHYQSDEGGTSIEMNERTIYVRGDIASTFIGYDAEKGTIAFGDSKAFKALDVKVGDYLYSTDRTDVFPNGYCFKVTEILKQTKAEDNGGSYGPGSAIGTELAVEEGFLTEAINQFNGNLGIDWQNLNDLNISAYEIDDCPDLNHIRDQVLDQSVFKKRPVGNGLSIKFGYRKTVIEYTIWKYDSGDKPWTPGVQDVDMKLAIVATLDHDLSDPTIYIHNGDFYVDADIEVGATLSLQFTMGGKNMNMEEMTKAQRQEFLKRFEQDQARVLGRQVRLAHIDFPTSPAKIIVNPSIDLLWDFRIDKIGGAFKFTVGYTGAQYNFHYERLNNRSDKLIDDKLLTKKKEAEWVLNVEGDLEGEVSTGPMVCFSIEIPAMQYSGNYKNVRSWKNYRGRTMPSFVGAYFEALLSGSFKLLAKYDRTKNSLLTKIILSLKLKLNVGIEYLLGFSKLLVGYDQKELNVKEFDWGTYEYTFEESGVGEYCVSPEVGSFIPEGDPVILEWGTSRDDGDKIQYSLFFGETEETMTLLKNNCKAGDRYQYEGSTPLKAGRYYWYVVGTTPDGEQVRSETWFFAIGDDPNESQELRAIELGLPSGITWGDRNIGAFYISDHGMYYQWGSTSNVGGSAYWDNYKWSNADGTKLKKYGFDDYLSVLQPEDDPAANTSRTGWRTPTKEEWDELKTYCSWTPAQKHGVSGYIVKNDDTGDFIFLPIHTTYIGQGGEHTSRGGFYWTSSLAMNGNPYLAHVAEVVSPDQMVDILEPRYLGLMVRPVFSGNMVPGMELSETELDFGDVAFSTTKTKMISVKNVGYSPLYFSIAAITEPFSSKSLLQDLAVAPGGTAILNIDFAPAEMKDYEGQLIISSNAASGAVKVPLRGKGVPKNDGGIDVVPGQNL